MSEAIAASLESSEEWNKPDAGALLESLTDGFYALDCNWCFIYVNAAAELLLGARRSQLLGRNVWDLYPAAVGTSSERAYRRVVHEQVSAEFDFYYEPWQRWFTIKAHPGLRGSLSVLFRDITEQKKILDEQRREWLTFDAVLSHIPDHTYILDLEGNFLYANRALLDFWHQSMEEVRGRSFVDLGIDASLASSLQQQIQEVAETGRPVRREAEFLDTKQNQQAFEYIFSPIFDPHGHVQGVAGCSRDIAEHKRGERRLTDRARLHAFGADVGAALTQLENLPDALQQCTQAMVRHLNATFARVWTLGADNMLELQASAGLYTHLNGAHARVPVGAFKIGRIAQERRPHLTNQVQSDSLIGDPAWAQREGMVAFAGYPMVVEDRLMGVLALFAREALAQDTLDALASVADTIAIGIERKRSEDVLSQQTQELARSNADLQQFAYITSHDLQEPLRTMSNFSQILMRRYGSALDDDAREFLGYIVTGAQRMKDLVESLLSYSHIVNVETMPFALVSLEAALQWAKLNLQTVIQENRAEVTQDLLPTVSADQVQMVQLLQNLIGNAIKYRQQGVTPQIHVSATAQSPGWLITVTDNGIGIPPEHRERIFGVFKRLHGREIPGTGIGLAICKRIVEKHGGRLWVQSSPGEGSIFLFTLQAQ